MKVTHWVNLVCMALLIFTGFLIHFPFWAGLTGVARGVHVFCGMLLVVNCILRIIFAFMFHSAPTGGTRNMVRDYKTYLPQADNRHQLGAWIKYYLFIKKDLILVMGYTGFCLWIPTASWSFFAAGTAAVGGMMSMRIIHYFMMFVFICFSMIHIYLVFIEGTANAKNMLAGKEHGGLVYDPERHCIVGEDHSVGDH